MDHELTQAEAQRVMFRYDHVHDCKRGIERWRETKREGREGLPVDTQAPLALL